MTRAEELAERSLIGIPGGFVEGVADCLPIDGDQWGYVLSQREFEALVADAEALAACREALETMAALVQDKYAEIDALTAKAEALAEALEECKHLIGRLVMRHGFTDEAKVDMRRVHNVSLDALARYRGEK